MLRACFLSISDAQVFGVSAAEWAVFPCGLYALNTHVFAFCLVNAGLAEEFAAAFGASETVDAFDWFSAELEVSN